ncbi:hypothetical protein PNEG_01512 [Pneumocystis murina B123]|uniref:Mitochondrial carrier n=1 Tax=Pneumocystis murina (strain B123) TaxID=1069680 RepID=M7NNH6_PNEMU|nr:hypothetical protein PNEG_01512 [Pneumocystis murina B123]EMR10243.1 hypothetical protein PNEG_01512 [Pneumocystis murina B123]
MNTKNLGLFEEGINPNRPYYIPSEYSYDINQGIRRNVTEQSSNKNWTESEYLNYFNLEGNKKLLKTLLLETVFLYLSVFIAQPFEIAKTLLQCQYHVKPGLQSDIEDKNKFFSEKMEEEDEDNDSIISNESDPPYFRDPDSLISSPDISCTSKKSIVDREGYVLTSPDNHEIYFPWQINVQNCGIRMAMSTLWKKEGILSLWKAQNISFVYNVLFSITESWISSFLLSIFSFPTFISRTIDFDNLLSSSFISLTSSAFTSLLLAPIDTARTRIMLTPKYLKSHQHLSSEPFFSFLICPTMLILPTLFYATLPNAFSYIVSIFFNRSGLVIDSYETPIMYNLISLLSSLTHLFIKLPLETILRRAQLHISNLKHSLIKPGRYIGISGTIWCILYEEDSRPYGLNGFYRGLKMSLYTLIGIWSLGFTSLSLDLPSNLTNLSSFQ